MKANEQARLKSKVLEQLTLSPIVEAACRKAGLPRATFYRWCEDDDIFAENVVLAKAQGRDRVNDMAESQIMKGIQSGEFRYVKFWLDHNSSRYIKKKPAKRPFKFFGIRLGPSTDEWEDS